MDIHRDACDKSPLGGRENAYILAFENTTDFYRYYLADCEFFGAHKDVMAGPTVFKEAVRARVKAREFVWQSNKVPFICINTFFIFILFLDVRELFPRAIFVMSSRT